MRTLRKLLAGLLVLFMGLPSVTFAQQRHVVDPAALANAVSEHVAGQDADRVTIREALVQPKLREMAAKTGSDLDRLTAAVGTMNGARLEQAAAAAQEAKQALVGGQSTRNIATTAVIAALLVGILVFVKGDYTDTCPRAECYK